MPLCGFTMPALAIPSCVGGLGAQGPAEVAKKGVFSRFFFAAHLRRVGARSCGWYTAARCGGVFIIPVPGPGFPVLLLGPPCVVVVFFFGGGGLNSFLGGFEGAAYLEDLPECTQTNPSE